MNLWQFINFWKDTVTYVERFCCVYRNVIFLFPPTKQTAEIINNPTRRVFINNYICVTTLSMSDIILCNYYRSIATVLPLLARVMSKFGCSAKNLLVHSDQCKKLLSKRNVKRERRVLLRSRVWQEI